MSVTIKTSLLRHTLIRRAATDNPNITVSMSTTPESSLQTSAMPAADTTLLREVAELVVSSLNLDTAAADIQPDDALYGDGLGLDSIDILEIALVVSKRYGIQLRADHEDNTAIFQSLRSLSEHIALQRTK
jgi:acyl carrier protein